MRPLTTVSPAWMTSFLSHKQTISKWPLSSPSTQRLHVRSSNLSISFTQCVYYMAPNRTKGVCEKILCVSDSWMVNGKPLLIFNFKILLTITFTHTKDIIVYFHYRINIKTIYYNLSVSHGYISTLIIIYQNRKRHFLFIKTIFICGCLGRSGLVSVSNDQLNCFQWNGCVSQYLNIYVPSKYSTVKCRKVNPC